MVCKLKFVTLKAYQGGFGSHLGLNGLNDKSNFRATAKLHGLFSRELNYQVPRDSHLMPPAGQERGVKWQV